MGVSRLLAVLGLTVAVVACGDNAKTSTAPATTTTTSTTVSSGALDAMLLDTADVGAGWQVGANVNDADFSDATKIPCPDTAINPTIATRLTPVTGIQFEPADGSYRHLIEFLVTGEPTRLDADLQVFIDAMDSCSTTTSTTDVTFTSKRLAIPELGDQRAAFTFIGAESAGATATWYVRGAQVRVGSVAIDVGLTEILSTPQEAPHLSDAEFVTLLERAVAKIRT